MNIQSYFQSYQNYFWQWEEKGTIVAIPSSNTITYETQVLELLRHIVIQGFPPFGSLLLAMAATNAANAEESLDRIHRICSFHGTEATTAINLALPFLQTLTKLPVAYKEGKNRILLMQTIFQDCHNILSNINSVQILQGYDHKTEVKEQIQKQQDFSWAVFGKEMEVLRLLSIKFPTVDVILKKITAQPEIEPASLVLPDTIAANKPLDFVEELIENPKTFHIGSLIRQIWSGLNIPFHNMLPSQQPMGGFSDLTNKGDFDKLLISEFANDDLLFLSRLANNEALYINREVPPISNNLERIILIDSSIKNWGTPKTIAFALMLAIAKHPKTNIACRAFVLGEKYEEVNFEDIHALINGLHFLHAGLLCGKGMELFFKEYQSQQKMEVFFISSADTMKMPAMQPILNQYLPQINYWILTDNEGHISLFKKHNNSKKNIQNILLPLDELWTRKKPFAQELPTKTPIQADFYPILFPIPLNRKQVLLLPNNDVYFISGEKAIFRVVPTMTAYTISTNNRPDYRVKGGEILSLKLPFMGGDFEIGETSQGQIILMLFHLATREFILHNLTTGNHQTCYFTTWKASGLKKFIFYKDKFYYFLDSYPRKYWSFELTETHIKIEALGVDEPQKSFFPSSELEEAYKKREKELTEILQVFPYNNTVFKNIHTIFINKQNNLVFNVHELALNKYDIIKIDKTNNLEVVAQANGIGNSQFQFRDGSIISIHRSGMLTLQSSNTNLPPIYVPSVLDCNLGVATATHFAGYPFYEADIPKQESITVLEFWDLYINRFINNILKNV